MHTRMMFLVSLTLLASPGCKDRYLSALRDLPKTPGNRALAEQTNYQGYVFMQAKEYDKAQDLFLIAAKQDPTLWTPSFNFAQIAVAKGKTSLAYDFLELAITRTSPQDAAGLCNQLKTDPDMEPIRNEKLYHEATEAVCYLGGSYAVLGPLGYYMPVAVPEEQRTGIAAERRRICDSRFLRIVAACGE